MKTLALWTAILVAAVAAASPQKSKVAFQVSLVHKRDGKTEIIASPYTAPTLTMESVSGPEPKEKEILYCTEETVKHPFADHDDNEVTFVCEGEHKLRLTGVDFQ